MDTLPEIAGVDRRAINTSQYASLLNFPAASEKPNCVFSVVPLMFTSGVVLFDAKGPK